MFFGYSADSYIDIPFLYYNDNEYTSEESKDEWGNFDAYKANVTANPKKYSNYSL